MTVSHKAGDILDGDNFDRLIAGKFPPVRRRSDVTDFVPTIEVDRPACSGDCAQGRHACSTPEACRLPDRSDADPRIVRRFWGGYAIVIALSVWAGVSYIRSFL